MSTDYAPLIAAANKLLQDAQTNQAVADRLIADPAKAIAEAAGRPLPKGVRLKFEQSADGKAVVLKPEVDPSFTGELDDKVLEAVAGGKGAGTAAGIAFGSMALNPFTGGLSGLAYSTYLMSKK